VANKIKSESRNDKWAHVMTLSDLEFLSALCDASVSVSVKSTVNLCGAKTSPNALHRPTLLSGEKESLRRF